MGVLRVVLISVLFYCLYYFLATPRALTFSDSAKTADSARFLLSNGYVATHHSFFDSTGAVLENYKPPGGFMLSTPPAMTYLFAFLFKFLPIADSTLSVVGMVMFVLSSLLLFSISKKITGGEGGMTLTIMFATNLFLLEYSVNLTSEIVYIFEILVATRLLLSDKLGFVLLSIFPLVLMYFTRAQAMLVYLSLGITFVYWVIVKIASRKKKLAFMFTLCFFAMVAIKFFNYGHHLGAIMYKPGLNPGLYLRGDVNREYLTPTEVVAKVVYNTYNFIRFPQRIIEPWVMFFCLVGVFPMIRKFKSRIFTVGVFSLFCLHVYAAALTIPNARYVHPALPLLFVIANLGINEIVIRHQIQRLRIFLALVTVLLSFNYIGHVLIDYRFRKNTLNIGKPTAVREISKEAARLIPANNLTITNLDAWAAWYQGITTMWFPTDLKHLSQMSGADKVSYILITSYKSEDGDFALNDWSELLSKPEDLTNKYLRDHYILAGVFRVDKASVYENIDIMGTVLKKVSK